MRQASSTRPTFNVTAPSEVYLGSSAVFRVDMYIPLVVADLSFEAFAPLNFTDAMSVCTALIVGVGKNFECLQFQNITPTLFPSDTGKTNSRVTLNIGHVINKGLSLRSFENLDSFSLGFVCCVLTKVHVNARFLHMGIYSAVLYARRKN